jgi:hypothetical protein
MGAVRIITEGKMMRATTRKRLMGVLIAGTFTVALSAPALADGFPPPEEPAKCNSGRGNNSETTPETDCDPGNSGGHNNGGD